MGREKKEEREEGKRKKKRDAKRKSRTGRAQTICQNLANGL